MNKRNLNEGLRSGDLKNYVSEIFTVDRYKSKMGEDQDIAVLSFHVKEKYPAMDLMEFIEKGYDFILDADISVGEEIDGRYQVFVELPRTPELSEQLRELLGGVGQLCDCREWKFKYQKSADAIEYSSKSLIEHVPTTPEEYSMKMVEIKNSDLSEFFDQGAVDIELAENNIITFKKPYSGDVSVEFVAIGPYDLVKENYQGPVSLDATSNSQVTFLNKFLGNYDINKIGNNFLIRNGENAVVITKNRW